MKAIIKSKIEELLSKEYYCSLDELNGKSTVYSVNFNAKQPYIKILAYRNCVVVCTSEDLYYKVRELLQNKNRDEIFELPLSAVMSMRAGSVTPRIPGMKDILAAGKKPYTVWDRSEFSSGKNGVDAISVLAPESVKRQCRLIRGSGEEELNEFCRLLRNTL